MERKHGGHILKQLRKLGASLDWSKERFTLDEGLSKAVREVFVDLYKKNLIYRGKRIINWDSKTQTADIYGHMPTTGSMLLLDCIRWCEGIGIFHDSSCGVAVTDRRYLEKTITKIWNPNNAHDFNHWILRIQFMVAFTLAFIFWSCLFTLHI